jgi:hypothetical protein
VIAGRYEPLGDGLARDVELQRIVELRWDEVDDPRLQHPNVVRVFDVGEHEGRTFAAVEHVQGAPLARVAPLPLDEAVTLGVQACRGLAAAHDLGLVHTGEILVRQDGVPKLTGFDPGEPGADVRALARALNDAAPGLPALEAETTTELALELERARPAATVPLPPVQPTQRRRSPVVPAVLVAVAVAALAIGLVAAFSGGAAPKAKPQVARVKPVPHAATPEQQAQNLSSWLARYSP